LLAGVWKEIYQMSLRWRGADGPRQQGSLQDTAEGGCATWFSW